MTDRLPAEVWCCGRSFKAGFENHRRGFHDIEWTKRRFWDRVAIGAPEECWEWRGHRRRREYGRFHWKGRDQVAHRVAYELTVGPIAEGLVVCHHCDNPPCCNPAHLFPGTVADNNHDRDRKGRHRTAYGEEVKTSILNAQQVAEIRRRYVPRVVTLRSLADEFGVTEGNVWAVVRRKTWKGVTP